MTSSQDYLLLDVREPWEFEEFNISGKLIPLTNLLSSLEELDAYREREIVVCCRTGNRSGMACMLLKANGFNKVHNLIGGVQAWQDAFGR